MNYDIYILQHKLSKILTEKRFYHSLGVQAMSLSLAARYGGDCDKAILAGLLHDCAKNLKNEVLLSECEKYDLGISEVERRNVYLLHGKLGAYYASQKYNITDKEVLSAIVYHTTGKPDMALLEKILFVADYIEPGRGADRIPELNTIRETAFSDLDKAVLLILSNTLSYLEEKGQEIDEMTKRAYEFYKNRF
ncbi:hydrolase [Anaerocolumna cellulosilytica]|uniref:bis(5'-nucleosyl)-tetraphosphatase (symmetrical) n=1 Tax=Anaerocolumna cellulosilytica TaxID=433286 RepID=A0A6S6R680_9FIRM|nr:bis(5'-nucleosyl)-tetraphosphatase (symmetrical) YqeK [Anaerocolumna cellulosilytica]MBB5193822.1 putative HD superfamily hydrolase involved in NAD metabolism [Anaerocolumna cellulosilytica]BCJ94962.1 hydrolase [Anaerocolumna cellulosilytica]